MPVGFPQKDTEKQDDVSLSYKLGLTAAVDVTLEQTQVNTSVSAGDQSMFSGWGGVVF